MADRPSYEQDLRERAQRDPVFRARLLADPAGAVGEALGVEIPKGLRIRVVEEAADEVVLVLPHVPDAAAPISESELAAVAGGSGASWCGNTQCSASCQCTSAGCSQPPWCS